MFDSYDLDGNWLLGDVPCQADLSSHTDIKTGEVDLIDQLIDIELSIHLVPYVCFLVYVTKSNVGI
jgi:hypothetical protein